MQCNSQDLQARHQRSRGNVKARNHRHDEQETLGRREVVPVGGDKKQDARPDHDRAEHNGEHNGPARFVRFVGSFKSANPVGGGAVDHAGFGPASEFLL